jgi:dihydrodipicolinate synthase/N-acetylneuraminate lyase
MTTQPPPEPVFRGVGVALATLFDSSGGLLLDETAKLAARVVEDGASAVLVAGTTGEFWTLTPDERLAVTSAVRNAVPPSTPVLLNVGAPTVAETLRVAERAGDAGVDAVLCLTPPDADPAQLYPQLRPLLGGLPLLAYHFPRAGFAPVPLEVLLEHVDGTKDSSGDAQRLAQTPALSAGVYTGSALLLSLGGALGIAGAILALANAEPDTAVAAWQGDPTAQRRMAELHLETLGDVPPRAVKLLTSRRYGTPPFTRTTTLQQAFAVV